MDNLIETVNLAPILERHGIEIPSTNFEMFYNSISADSDLSGAIEEIEDEIERYFRQLKLPDQPNLYDKLILCLREKQWGQE
jgi:hypothetical protein